MKVVALLDGQVSVQMSQVELLKIKPEDIEHIPSRRVRRSWGIVDGDKIVREFRFRHEAREALKELRRLQ